MSGSIGVNLGTAIIRNTRDRPNRELTVTGTVDQVRGGIKLGPAQGNRQ